MEDPFIRRSVLCINVNVYSNYLKYCKDSNLNIAQKMTYPNIEWKGNTIEIEVVDPLIILDSASPMSWVCDIPIMQNR